MFAALYRGLAGVMLVVIAFGLAPDAARAGIINSYTDRAGFEAASGATSITGPIPDLGNVGTGPNTLGDVTFDSLSGDLFFGTDGLGGPLDTDGWSTLIDGNDIAISGEESFEVDIDLAGGVLAFGFVIHEPTSTARRTPDACNFDTCPDSTFELALYSGASLVDSIEFNPDNDVLAFFGVTTDMIFDRATIIETEGNDDNEYFGEFLATRVPAPATFLLLALGLLGLRLVPRSPRR